MNKEQETIQRIASQFENIPVKVIRDHRIQAEANPENLEAVLSWCKHQLGFIHLSHISVVDWLEAGQFELVYILWNFETKINIFVKVQIPRDTPEILTLKHLWPQVHTYEREIHEMYGINFLGNEDLREFILEDWDDKPPMRRDFDTVEYVNKTFFERPGREDKKDVREFIAARTLEEIPQYAKKYSR